MLKWAIDPIVESKLKQLGATFRYVPGIQLESIDVFGSRRNNARLSEEWNEGLSIEYGVAMADGDTFPAPVFRQVTGDFSYFILSGNHRVGAAKLLEETNIDAYVVAGDDELVMQMITRAANRWMGDRQSKEEAVEHARMLITQYSKSVKEMAKLFGLKPDWLSKAIKAEQTRDNLAKCGVETDGLSRAILQTIGGLDHNERVMSRAASVASRFKLTGDRVRDLVASVKLGKSEDDQLEAVKVFEDRVRSERLPPAVSDQSQIATRRPERARLMQYVNTLHSFLITGRRGHPFETLEQIGVTSRHDRHDLRERFKCIRKSMETLFVDADRREAASQNNLKKGVADGVKTRRRG